jgi:hypothetical protein
VFAGGIAAGLALGALLIAISGSLPGFWRWTVEVLYGYASTQLTAGALFTRTTDSLVPFVVDMAVLWIAAIAYALRWRTLSVQERLMVLWLVIGMAGSFAGGHLSWHYFIQAMAPLAVLAALTLSPIIYGGVAPPRSGRAEGVALRRWLAVGTVAGILIPVAAWWIFDVRADPLTYDWTGPAPQHEAVAAYIHDHTSASDRVFVWGVWPALYVESDRLMASRFPGFLRGFPRGSGLPPNNWDTAPDVWPLLAADLNAHPPALIADTAAAGWSDFGSYPMNGYPVLRDLVSSRYHRVANVDGVVIYARNSG